MIPTEPDLAESKKHESVWPLAHGVAGPKPPQAKNTRSPKLSSSLDTRKKPNTVVYAWFPHRGRPVTRRDGSTREGIARGKPQSTPEEMWGYSADLDVSGSPKLEVIAASSVHFLMPAERAERNSMLRRCEGSTSQLLSPDRISFNPSSRDRNTRKVPTFAHIYVRGLIESLCTFLPSIYP